MKAVKLEIRVFRQEALLLRGRRKEEEGRSQKKCFYKYEMLPILVPAIRGRPPQVPGVRTISVPISTAVVIFTSIELTLFYCNAASFLPDRIYQG